MFHSLMPTRRLHCRHRAATFCATVGFSPCVLLVFASVRKRDMTYSQGKNTNVLKRRWEEEREQEKKDKSEEQNKQEKRNKLFLEGRRPDCGTWNHCQVHSSHSPGLFGGPWKVWGSGSLERIKRGRTPGFLD